MWLVALLAMVVTGFLLYGIAELVSVRNLLLSEPSKTCAADGLTAAILHFDEQALRDRSEFITTYSALAIGVGAFAVPRLAAGQGPALPLLICIAVGINAALSVPISHGILRGDTRWQSVTGDQAFATVPTDALRLLGRTPDGIWAWEPAARTVHLFVAGTFDHLRIGPARTMAELLNCPAPGAATREGDTT